MGIIKSDAGMELVGVAGERAVVSRWWLPELVEVHAGTSHVGCERFCTEWAIEDVEMAKWQMDKEPDEEGEEELKHGAHGAHGGRQEGVIEIRGVEDEGARYSVDVQELARTGSINGQALWGVRVKAKSEKRKAKMKSVEEKAARVRGVRLDPSASPIHVWDAGEAAEEMRGET